MWTAYERRSLSKCGIIITKFFFTKEGIKSIWNIYNDKSTVWCGNVGYKYL